MSNLAEIEKMARDCDGFEGMKLADIRECRRMEAANTLMEYGLAGAENSAILARFILRALPLIRAAEAHAIARKDTSGSGTAWDVMNDTSRAIEQAHDAFRSGDK